MRFLLAFIFLFSQTTFGQTTGKQIEFNSVNGADYFTNYVLSPNARKNASNTTVSNATVTRDTTAGNLIDNVASYSVDTSLNAGYVEFTLGTVYDPATSGSCEFKGVFKGDGTLYSAQIVDGSGNLLNSATLTNETAWRGFSVIYPCAASGSRKVRITQTTAGTSPAINVGKLYYGQVTGIGAGVPNNTFSAKVSNTGVVSDENEDFLNGNLTVTSNTLFGGSFVTGKFTVAPTCVIVNNLPAGAINTNYGRVFNITTSAFNAETANTNTTTAAPFNLICTRAGTDFIQPTITASQWNFDWTTCPTITGGFTNTTYTCKYMRKGGDAYFDITAAITGTPVGSLSLTLPVTIDTSKMTASNAGVTPLIGSSVTARSTGGTTTYFGQAIYNSTTSVLAAVWKSDATYVATLTGISPTVPFTFANTDYVNIKFSVPVLGWTENQNAPQLVNSVITQYSGVDSKIESNLHCFTAASITSQSGGLSSIGNRSTNTCALTINAGVFSATPWKCSVTVNSTTVQSMGCTCSSATACTIAGPNADYDAFVSIEGPK